MKTVSEYTEMIREIYQEAEADNTLPKGACAGCTYRITSGRSALHQKCVDNFDAKFRWVSQKLLEREMRAWADNLRNSTY